MNERLRLAKIINGGSVNALAEKAGLKYDRLISLLYHNRRPTESEAAKIAEVLHRRAATLFGEIKK